MCWQSDEWRNNNKQKIKRKIKTAVEKNARYSNHYSVDVITHQLGDGPVLKEICCTGMLKTQEQNRWKFFPIYWYVKETRECQNYNKNPHENDKTWSKWAGHSGQSVGLQHSLHCWETWMAGPTGWVWKSADIPPFWDKDNTDSRPAVDDSQLQQMRLGAWQQLSPCPTTASLQPIIAGIQMTDGSSSQPC